MSGPSGTKSPRRKRKPKKSPSNGTRTSRHHSPPHISQAEDSYYEAHEAYHNHYGHGHDHEHDKNDEEGGLRRKINERKREPTKELEDLKEAEHYVDVLNHFKNYATHSLQRFQRVESDFRRIDPNLLALISIDKKLPEIRSRILKNQEFIMELYKRKYAFENPDLDYSPIEKKSTTI